MTKVILGPLALAFGLMLISSVDRTDGHVSVQDAKALWKHMVEGLFFLAPKDRQSFIKYCLKKTFCGTEMFDSAKAVYHWKTGGVNKAQKTRFWSIYTCVFRRSLHKCPVDGGWSVWSKWTACQAECGEQGVKTRSRLCNNPIAKHSGLPCRGLKEMSAKCAGACDASHVDGMQEAEEYLKRIHASVPALRDECIHHHCTYDRVVQLLDPGRWQKYWSSLLCVKYYRACPVDGGWGQWSEWTECSKKCGYGRHERERFCDSPAPEHGGVVCDGKHFHSEPCFSTDCQNPEYNGVLMSEWSDYSSCSISCGAYGQQESIKICLKPDRCADEKGNLIDKLVINKPCYLGPCPQTGGWSKWSQWSPCSAYCSRGRRTQIRMCINPLPSGGLDCLGLSIKTGLCTGNKCDSTAQPNTGVNFGVPESDEMVEPASGDPFFEPLSLSLESRYTAWSFWTKCSHTCSGGHRSRWRTCLNKSKVCKGEIKQDQFCDLEPCPVAGGWSDWLAWSPCGETCGPSHRVRYRQCDEPLPAYGGACFGEDDERKSCNLGTCKEGESTPSGWSKWSKCSTTCGDGFRTRTSAIHQTEVRDTCNLVPCPVPGAWSNWGEWSACTVTCGLGQHFRDRACSDPSPAYGGADCFGSGSEILHCYKGPCTDADDKGLTFTSISSMFYHSFVKPTRFLLLYLRLLLWSSSGILLERQSGCTNATGCAHRVVLSVQNGIPTLTVRDGKSSLKVVANLTLEIETWNDVQVGITSQHAYIRVNDARHVMTEFDEPLTYDINFDADMFIGSNPNHSLGFHGVISELRQNYKPLNLIRSMDWVGPGSPSKQKAVVETALEPEVSHSDFRGHFYAKLHFEHTEVLQIQLTMQIYSLDGLILYNEGQVPGSFVAMYVEKGAAKMCLNCGIEAECQESVDLQLRRWYYITLQVYGLEAELRIDRHPAVQITGVGKKYFPTQELFLGKTEPAEWLVIQMVTGVRMGFSGIVDVLVVNGQRFTFKRAALLDSDGFMNSMGYTMSAHLDEILEHTEDIVYLRCDYTDFGSTNVYVEWLQSDRLLREDSGTIIIPKLPGRRNESAIHLLPEKHTQGMYTCAVNKNGRLILTHAFALWRHTTSKSILVEMDETDVGIVIVSIILVITLVAGIFRVIVVRRRSYALAKESARRASLVTGAPVEKIRKPSVSFNSDPTQNIIQENVAANACVFGEECLEGSRFVIIDGVPVMIDDDDDDDAGTETTATTAETTETDTTEDSEETTTANETEDGESEDPVVEVERALRAEAAAKLISNNKDKVLDIIQSISSMGDTQRTPLAPRRASSVSPTHTLSSTITPQPASHRKMSIVSTSPQKGAVAAETRYSTNYTNSARPASRRPSGTVQSSPPYQGLRQRPSFQGSQTGPVYQGYPYHESQSEAAFQGPQKRHSFQESQSKPVYQRPQATHSYQGSQVEPAYLTPRTRDSYQESHAGSIYRGSQAGYSYHEVQGPQAGPSYQEAQRSAYQGPQAGPSYQEAQRSAYQGPPAGPSYREAQRPSFQETQAGPAYQGRPR